MRAASASTYTVSPMTVTAWRSRRPEERSDASAEFTTARRSRTSRDRLMRPVVTRDTSRRSSIIRVR